jgi:hypothetical protein
VRGAGCGEGRVGRREEEGGRAADKAVDRTAKRAAECVRAHQHLGRELGLLQILKHRVIVRVDHNVPHAGVVARLFDAAVLDLDGERPVKVLALAHLEQLWDRAQLVPRQPPLLEQLQEALVVDRVGECHAEAVDAKVVREELDAEGERRAWTIVGGLILRLEQLAHEHLPLLLEEPRVDVLDNFLNRLPLALLLLALLRLVLPRVVDGGG